MINKKLKKSFAQPINVFTDRRFSLFRYANNGKQIVINTYFRKHALLDNSDHKK